MHRFKKHRIAMLVMAMMLLIGGAVQTTLAYLSAESGPVKNTFVPVQSIKGLTVAGDKDITGRSWQEGDSFIFTLQQWDGSEWVTKGNASAAYDADKTDYDKFDLSEVVLQQLTGAGSYSFRIIEGEGSLPNMTYDDTVCRFDVKVTADSMGNLDISSVKGIENTSVAKDAATGDYMVGVKFVNEYKEPVLPPEPPTPDDIKVRIDIDKVVKNEGDGEIGPEGFKFKLVKDYPDETLTETSNKDGEASFELKYTADDAGKTYIYEVSEVNDGREYVTYDDRVYEIRIGIELNENNVLVPTVTCDGKAVNKVTAEFENIYDDSEKPSDPTDPSDPSEPSEPSDPTEPSDPSGPDDPTDPTEPAGPGKDDVSQTGDDFNLTPLLLIMLASIAVMAAVIVFRRRKVDGGNQ